MTPLLDRLIKNDWQPHKASRPYYALVAQRNQRTRRKTHLSVELAQVSLLDDRRKSCHFFFTVIKWIWKTRLVQMKWRDWVRGQIKTHASSRLETWMKEDSSSICVSHAYALAWFTIISFTFWAFSAADLRTVPKILEDICDRSLETIIRLDNAWFLLFALEVRQADIS